MGRLCSAISVVLTLLLCSANAAAARSWTLDSSIAANTMLTAVSCTARNTCMAVGGLTGYLGSASYAHGWRQETMPDPSTPGGPEVSLRDVSCASSTECFAVGGDYTYARAYVWHWNGSTWSLRALRKPGGGDNHNFGVFAISCPSTRFCMAVGYRAGIVNTTVAERFNGQRWMPVAISSPTNSNQNARTELTDISCSSATTCVAVGHSWLYAFPQHYNYATFAEAWNGTTWRIVRPVEPTQATSRLLGSSLDTVSCTTATRCLAIGHYADRRSVRILTERFNGRSWTIVGRSQPNAGALQYLQDLSCAGNLICTAVGGYRSPVAAHWNGNQWAPEQLPRPSGRYASLSGVSCVSPTACVAVGAADAAFAERSS